MMYESSGCEIKKQPAHLGCARIKKAAGPSGWWCWNKAVRRAKQFIYVSCHRRRKLRLLFSGTASSLSDFERGLVRKRYSDGRPGLQTSSVRKPDKLIVSGLQTKPSCLHTNSVCTLETLDKFGLQTKHFHLQTRLARLQTSLTSQISP